MSVPCRKDVKLDLKKLRAEVEFANSMVIGK